MSNVIPLSERERRLVELTYNYCQEHPLGVEDMNDLFEIIAIASIDIADNAGDDLPPAA